MKIITKYILSLLILSSILLFKVNAQAPSGGYKVGDMAKDFKLKNTDGIMISFADYKTAKGLIVVFTCNHCPFAQAYEQRIIDLHRKYTHLGYPVVAINPNDPEREPDDSYEKMQERAFSKMYPFFYLFDSTQQVAKTYGAVRTPHVFLLKKTAKGYRVEYIGAIDDNYEDAAAVKEKFLENAIARVNEGKPASPSMTKAIGCGIKWRK